jgi:integrase
MAAKGTYRQQGEGSWEIRISTGQKDPETGVYERYRETYYTDASRPLAEQEKTVKEYIEKLAYEIKTGKKPTQNNLTLAKFFEYWIQNYVEPSLKRTTLRGYRETVKNHINPYMGTMKLKDLTPLHIEQLYNKLRAKGASPHIIKDVHTVWGSSLERAYIWGMIPERFKLDRIEPIPRKERIQLKAQKKKKIVWDAEQAYDFLEYAEQKCDRRYYIYLVAFTTGLRRGENIALKWDKIDFENHKITIAASITDNIYDDYNTKTESSVDDVYMIDFLAEKLQQYKELQDVDKTKYRRAYAPDNWVHANPLGELIMRPDTVSDKFKKDLINCNFDRQLAGKEPLPMMVLHDLRHTLATLLYEKFKVPMNLIGEILRHSDPNWFRKVYAHPTVNIQKEPLENIDHMLRGNIFGGK